MLTFYGSLATLSLCATKLHNEDELTPERHEDGEEDGRLVVEEVHDLGVQTGLAEVPVITEVITGRADLDVVCVTNVLAERDI